MVKVSESGRQSRGYYWIVNTIDDPYGIRSKYNTSKNRRGSMNNQELFEKWMRNNSSISEVTIKKYSGAINTNSKDLEEVLKETIDIYSILDIEELDEIIKVYTSTNILVEKNKRGNNMYTAAFSKYREFLVNLQLNEALHTNNILGDKTRVSLLHQYIYNKGFIYNQEDLSNFYLSLKTKPFIILAGVSGTGKSKLVKLFSEAIGSTSSNGQYKLISVKPDWNDSTELLGYKNIKDEFIPGKLLQIIKEASKVENKNKPYFVCLDEMNLARVEYYLSEYLSIVESREFNKAGEIVTDNIFSNNYLPEDNEYAGLSFPENLYVIGTVNMDDTTFAFSRKVLDRANTIEFSEVDLETLDFLDGEAESIEVDNSFLKTSFLNIKDALTENREYVESINSNIVEINNILKEYSKHFGYRVRDEIVFYMLENHLAQLLDQDTAFDYQIMQKILPTIIGSDECIKDILIKLYNYCVGYELNPNGDYVEEAKKNLDKAKYKLSANKIYTMLRGYRDGYTSFWL